MMDANQQTAQRICNTTWLRWSWRAVLLLFLIAAAAGWTQMKRSRVVYTPTPVGKEDWRNLSPIGYSLSGPGECQMEFIRMMGPLPGSTNHVPEFHVQLPHRMLGYVLHVAVHRTDRRASRLQVAINGHVLATHQTKHKRRADFFEVAVPAELLQPGKDNRLSVTNVGGVPGSVVYSLSRMGLCGS